MRTSSKSNSIFIIHILGIIMLIESLAYYSSEWGSNSISNTILASNSAEHKLDISNTSSQRTHDDLIRTCSTYREILSTEVAFSCDYSMLYYQGQCELYSDLLRQNKTDAILKAENDLSFCSDPRVGKYIQDHDLTNAPRSPSLIPSYQFPVA
jgi:hypothetical protein